MKNNKNIYQNTLIASGKINLRELARLTLLSILSVKGVIYTHYKNKQLNKGKNEYNTIRKRNNQSY
jgi:cell division protein FtsL